MPEAVACERCGTFAVLRSDGFRTWCEPCWALQPHELDRPLHDLGSLFGATFALLRDYLALGLLLGFGFRAIPGLLLVALGEPSYALKFGLDLVGSTIAEAILLSAVLTRTICGKPAIDWPAVWQRVKRRAVFSLGTNLATGTLATVGFALCVLPGVLLSAIFSVAVPLVLFEELPIHKALSGSVRRSMPHVWKFFVLLLPFALISFSVSLLPTVLKVTVLKDAEPAVHTYVRLGEVLVFALLTVPSMLTQVVLWSATRPGPSSEIAHGNVDSVVAGG